MDQHHWREYPFDLSKPLPLIEDRGRQVVPADFFINTSEYLKVEVQKTWFQHYIAVKLAYNKLCYWGSITGVQNDKDSMHMHATGNLHMMSTPKIRILALQGRRLPRLNLCDIEDMLLLLVQKKLSNLDVDDRYDLGVALRMFTRRIVILHRVQDLQLGVESYQKKLNITRPETTRSNISKLTPITIQHKTLQGIIFKTSTKEHRLLCSDELYNFTTGRSFIVRKLTFDVEKRLFFVVVLMRNLEKFVGGRDYGNDLRLLERNNMTMSYLALPYFSLPVLKEFCPEIQVKLPSEIMLVKRCGF
ncbi:hypothetical protein Tco_0715973 [Tanacetum coccineum]